MARRKGSPFRGGGIMNTPVGREAPDDGLGEYMGNPRVFQVLPHAAEVIQDSPSGPMQVRSRPRTPTTGVDAGRLRQQIVDADIAIQRTIPQIAEQIEITFRQNVNVTTPTRLDTGLAHRVEITIVNQSINILWVNKSAQVTAVNVGIPIPGASAAGAFDGGSLVWSVTEDVEFWGIMSADAANDILILEGGRR